MIGLLESTRLLIYIAKTHELVKAILLVMLPFFRRNWRASELTCEVQMMALLLCAHHVLVVLLVWTHETNNTNIPVLFSITLHRLRVRWNSKVGGSMSLSDKLF